MPTWNVRWIVEVMANHTHMQLQSRVKSLPCDVIDQS